MKKGIFLVILLCGMTNFVFGDSIKNESKKVTPTQVINPKCYKGCIECGTVCCSAGTLVYGVSECPKTCLPLCLVAGAYWLFRLKV